MCIFGGRRAPAPTPLPPPPPPPLPPAPTTPPPDAVNQDVNPQVETDLDETGDKTQSQQAMGTNQLRIEKDPPINNGSPLTPGSGGLN